MGNISRMDNPQHYQPLSHALHAPPQPAYGYRLKPAVNHHEDDEDSGDDQGAAQDQLREESISPALPPPPCVFVPWIYILFCINLRLERTPNLPEVSKKRRDVLEGQGDPRTARPA